MKRRLLAVSVILLLSYGATANGALVTDGSLSVDVRSNGTFGTVVLKGTAFETGNGAGIHFMLNNGVNFGFVNGSAVTISGPSATFTARTHNGIDVAATSILLGALASNPTTTGVLEQEFVFTNNGAAVRPLAVVSGNDPDLNFTGDITAFDATTQSVFIRDSALPGELVAVISQADDRLARFGFDVGFFFPDAVFPLNGNTGPVGPGDVAMTIGFDFGSLSPGESQTVRFRYLFGTNLSSPPSDFEFGEVPEPSTLAIWSLLGALGITAGRWRRRKAA